jgi:hypothetical protein
MIGTTSDTQERIHPAQGCTQTLLLLALTCNKGLTNPEYKGTQQDLTDKKGNTPRICRLTRNQDKYVARIKNNFCRKAY